MPNNFPPLALRYGESSLEAGLDEAGRGCLAGPVVAAAVMLPDQVDLPGLTDSKLLSHARRLQLRELILEQAEAWCVGMSSAQRIDEVNILQATYDAMHEAIAGLPVKPELLAIDGHQFRPFPEIDHVCLVKGDRRFLNIAAASILAKTYRDELMIMLDAEYPGYGWATNKGYPTRAHKVAIQSQGVTPFHRETFNWELKEE